MATMEREELKRVAQARLRWQLAELTYKREVKAALQTATQVEVAAAAGISQASVSKTASKPVEPVKEGFSGATPREICERFAVEELTREQMIDELSRFPYTEAGISVPDPGDDLTVTPAGGFGEVVYAVMDGLIDADAYAQISAATTPKS